MYLYILIQESDILRSFVHLNGTICLWKAQTKNFMKFLRLKVRMSLEAQTRRRTSMQLLPEIS